MRRAIKLGLLIYIFIKLSYIVGCEKLATDESDTMPEYIDTTVKINPDTARHYKQDFTPFSKKNKVVQMER